jgi:hypothetical protein
MIGTRRVVLVAVGLLAASVSVSTAQGAGSRHLLTGTYQLDVNRGDDPRLAADRAANAVPPDQRQRTYESLVARLEAPDQIAIERNRNLVTMASTRAPRVSFDADGMDRQEQWSAGRTMSTRATIEGERLVIVTTGNRGSDFTVTFDPVSDGRTLYMTRTIDDERLREPVTVRSTYRRLSNQARWNVDASAGAYPPSNPGVRGGELGVPDGTRLVVVLDSPLTTSNARDGDRYTMTTRSPARYQGAVIQGFVSTMGESGRETGRAGMTLNLQSIRLRNGRTYQFDGVIVDVRTPDGTTVRVNREGTFDSGQSQTEKVVERSVFGAAIGALIGAATGGGKGAAIGAAIGAGGGAGTVLIEGRDRLDLPRGTELTITTGDPRNQPANPGARR